jgi:hypothetical protein
MRISNFSPGRALSLLDVRFLAVCLPLVAALGTLVPVVALGAAGAAGQTSPPVDQKRQAPSPTFPKPAPAGPLSGTLPAAQSIIDRYIEAIGGRKAVLAHTSSHVTGTMSVEGSGVSGVLDVYAATPDKALMKINLGGIGEVIEGFDGTNGWSVSPITGPMLAIGKELEQKKFDAAFYADLHEPGRYASMKTVEKIAFEGRPCYKVSLMRKDGGEDLELFDVQTGLKVAAILTRESPMGPIAATQSQTDYKKFGNVLVPTTLKATTMGVVQVFTISTLEFDTVAPSVFEPPAAIKALLAK